MNAIGSAARQVDGHRVADWLGLFQSIGRVVLWCRLVGDLLLGQSPLSWSSVWRFIHPSIAKWLSHGETGIRHQRHWSTYGRLLDIGTSSTTDVQSTWRGIKKSHGFINLFQLHRHESPLHCNELRIGLQKEVEYQHESVNSKGHSINYHSLRLICLHFRLQHQFNSSDV